VVQLRDLPGAPRIGSATVPKTTSTKILSAVATVEFFSIFVLERRVLFGRRHCRILRGRLALSCEPSTQPVKIEIDDGRCIEKVSEGVRESFWLQGMMAGMPASYFCIKAFSETDQTEDLKKIDKPTLILHGDDDQIVPIGDSAMLSSN
jgi:pimeloyl-ACP methyl ester carboxylesterase